MNDWQKMEIYTESRYEDIRGQSKTARMFGHRPFPVKAITLATALILGILIWWIR